MRFLYYGWIPEWPKGADCKSVGDAFEGSNPSPSIQERRHLFKKAEGKTKAVRILLHPFKKADIYSRKQREKPKRFESFSIHSRKQREKPKRFESFSYNETNSEYFYAAVAELADAQDLKSCGGDIVPVRFRSAALRLNASNPCK